MCVYMNEGNYSLVTPKRYTLIVVLTSNICDPDFDETMRVCRAAKN